MIVVRCSDLDRDALARTLYDPEDLKDDGTNYLGVRITKPWGHEVERFCNDDISVWFLNVRPDCETSLHCHIDKTTLLFVLSGKGTLLTLDKTYGMSEGGIFVIEKGAFHRTRADSNGLMLYELEHPVNKRDLVRLEDKYHRGQGYERVQPPGEISAA